MTNFESFFTGLIFGTLFTLLIAIGIGVNGLNNDRVEYLSKLGFTEILLTEKIIDYCNLGREVIYTNSDKQRKNGIICKSFTFEEN